MKDLLKNLREHLSAMIEEIDNYTHANSDDIIIEKKNFKYLTCVIQNFKTAMTFRYKNEILFEFNMTDGYQKRIYDELVNGSLDMLVLKSREEPLARGDFQVNYEIESSVNTMLRKTYRPIPEDNEENK